MRALAVLLLATLGLPLNAQPLADAFDQGAALGRSGNAAARGQISSGTAQATVPHYTAQPPEASYFGSPGLGSAAAARSGACARAGAASGFNDQACNAVQFAQTNPARRPAFSLSPGDPLLTRGRTITADPQAIAGNIAGTYSACGVQTVTRPDIFTTALCHRYREIETVTCQKVLTVHLQPTPTCAPGTWFGNYWVNTWGNGEVGRRYAGIAIDAFCEIGDTVRLRLTAICTEAPCAGVVQLAVDAATGAEAPQTFANFIGRSWFATDVFNRVDYHGGGCSATECRFAFCTRYEEATTTCDDQGCTTTPVSEPRACGTFAFARPRTVLTATDAWDNRCAPLEARLP